MKDKLLSLVRWSEKYTKTDMVYVLTNTFWMNANTLVVTGGSFLLYLVIGNYLAKEVYGIYQFVLSVGLIINSLTLTGMNIAVNRSVARGYDGILQISVREQLKYSILPFIVGIGISIYYLINNNTLLFFGIILTSIILPITNSLNTWSAFVNGKKDFKTWFLYNQIINILYYGGLIAIILFIPKSIFLILVSLLSNLISNAIAYKKTIEKYEPDETKIDDETLIYGKKLSLSGILPTIAVHIDNLIVFHFLGATNLAIYLFASNIPERFMSFLRPISNIALPKLAIQNQEQISKTILEKTLRLFIISGLFGLIYITISPFVFKIFFNQYIESIRYSQIYVLSLVISTVTTLSMTSLYAIKSDRVYILNIIHPILSILIIFFSIYIYGIWGLIFGKIINSMILFILSKYSILKTSNKNISSEI